MENERPIIFITGGTGFIGKRLVEILLDELLLNNPENLQIRILARSVKSLEDWDNVIKNDKYSELLEVRWGALQYRQKVLNAMVGNIVYIYHVAAVGGDWGPKHEFWDCNVTGTRNVVDGAIKLKNLRRFLHVSTVDVYPHELEPKDCFEDVEITTKNRKYWYSITKVMAEQIVQAAKEENGIPVTIVRPAAVFGPRSYSFGYEEAKILTTGVGVLISRGQYPCGAIYVDECVEHMLQASRSSNTIGKIYNASANQNITWLTYYNSIADNLNVSRPRFSIPLWFAKLVARILEYVWMLFGWEDRPYLTVFLLALIARPQLWPIGASKRDFGWEPRVPFNESIRETCKWLKTINFDEE